MLENSVSFSINLCRLKKDHAHRHLSQAALLLTLVNSIDRRLIGSSDSSQNKMTLSQDRVICAPLKDSYLLFSAVCTNRKAEL